LNNEHRFSFRSKNDFSGYLERAANEDFTVTNNGKPVAVIHGFAHEEDYFE
jgi:prevent-host-death family protein